MIGAGNLAWHLAPALDNAGFVIKEVYSRNPKHAEVLTERLYQAEVKASNRAMRMEQALPKSRS